MSRRPAPRSSVHPSSRGTRRDGASRVAAVLAAATLIGPALASCGKDAAPAGVTGSRGATSSNAVTDGRAQGVKFAECMRSHAVTDFPDPNARGEFEYGVSVGPEVWRRAVDACRALQPPGTLSADRTPQQQSEGLAFAKCMRAEGIRDFPDPVNGEPLIDTTKIPSANAEGGMTLLDAAIAACRTDLAGAAGGR